MRQEYRMRCVGLLILAFAAPALAGCQEDSVAAETPPRPIRTFTVTEAAGGMVRRFTGVSEAAESATLSFPVAGTVEEVLVAVGDSVGEGSVIAWLDPEPFELDVQAARAEVESAQANLAAKRDEMERNRALFDKGWVAAAALDNSQAAYDAAVSNLDYARSRLSLAERNLGNATLLSPYAGTIASKAVEQFEDVAAGQPIVELNSADGLLVAFAVPETGIGRIALGQPVSITFTALQLSPFDGRVTEIETAASAGNAFTVKASILEAGSDIRPGMTAQVAITDASDSPDGGYLVPLSAIAPGDAEHVGSVFRYVPSEEDPNVGNVQQIPVQARGVIENLVIVQQGIEPGDLIASAGVSFLLDGQPVRLLEN